MVKSFDDLTIVDDFIFCTVMEDPKLCKELLTMLLKDKIDKITKLFKQKPIETQIASKGVRLDIMIEDEQGKLYDVEMPFSARHPCLTENTEFCVSQNIAFAQKPCHPWRKIPIT